MTTALASDPGPLDRDRTQQPLQRRPRASAAVAAHLAGRQFRRALDFDVGLYSDLHARLLAYRRRDELVGGDPHYLSREPDRRCSDDSERACRDEVWNSVSGFLPRLLGTRGANVPALLRAFVACGWFGIQTWIGGAAIYKILVVFMPSLADPEGARFLGITLPEFICFLFFWSINMFVVYKGIESIRLLLNIKAPLLIVLGLCLLAWAYRNAGGFGPILAQPSAFAPGQPKAGQFWSFFVPGLTGMIGFWATLSLNIPDFSRYARSQRDQIAGQVLGLPLTMALYAFIGVAVTSATTIIYGKTIWDPVDVLTHFQNPIVLVIALFALCLATLATNLAANVVSPANDFANLAPRRISFRLGGLITGVVGILMMPWKLVADPSGYIFTWLIGYSALLGPIGGIMIADYFILRRRQLNVAALYQTDGEYQYTNGFSIVALIALAVAVLPNLPGFLVTVKLLERASVPEFFVGLYSYAWFAGFGIALATYISLRRLSPAGSPE